MAMRMVRASAACLGILVAFFARDALATSSVSVRLSVEGGRIYADVMADGRGNWSDDPLRVYWRRGGDANTYSLKDRTLKGELYKEHLFVAEAKPGQRIEVFIESMNSGKRIADSDSWPK